MSVVLEIFGASAACTMISKQWDIVKKLRVKFTSVIVGERVKLNFHRNSPAVDALKTKFESMKIKSKLRKIAKSNEINLAKLDVRA